jgi:hypothetical protein
MATPAQTVEKAKASKVKNQSNTRNHPLSGVARGALTQASFDIINTMVKAGYTFFSSIKTDTQKHQYHVPTDYAMEDTMFFHIPDTGVLIKLSLNANFRGRTLSSYLRCELMLETKPLVPDSVLAYKTIMALARDKGFVDMKYLSSYDIDETEVIVLPFVHDDPKMIHWTDFGGSSSHHQDSTRYIDKPFETEQTLDHKFDEALAELTTRIAEVLPFVASRDKFQFRELMSSTFWPYHTFKSSEEDFWSQFNTRYFRPLVKKAY